MCLASVPKVSRPKVFSFDDIDNFINDTFQREKEFVIKIDKKPLSDHPIEKHDYHDHANDTCQQNSEQRSICRGGVVTPFPVKLYEMLDSIEEDGHTDIISWQPHGRCFVIHKPNEFKEIIPKYFKQSKITSFRRQLNLYGFSRLTQGKDKGGYYHEFFLRGKKFLCHEIRRTKVKGTGVRARTNPAGEPNLWAMEWVGCNTQIASSDDSNASRADIVPSSCTSAPNITSNNATMNTPTLPFNTAANSLLKNFHNAIQKRVPIEKPEQDNALVCSFEGMKFHYLDPIKAERVSSSSDTILNNGFDELDQFISEIDWEDICRDINTLEEEGDDNVFADMIERAVA